jgi:uncharacterized membrane protein
MKPDTNRLHFIDAMRAWAILMMLQGHFVDGLLEPIFRNTESSTFLVWQYFRGITAPVFFTVSGFIFTYLLIRVPLFGFENPRVRKGIRRGLQLLLIGYLLRLNLFGLLQGQVYDSLFLVDVLHCIGISILVIIGIFLLAAHRKKYAFPGLLLAVTLALFLFEPLYKQWDYNWLPTALANYFTKANGSVFTVIPWVGYTAFGAFLAILFKRFKEYKRLYPTAIMISLLSGVLLLFFSSPLFVWLNEQTGISLFNAIAVNNYLFIRLGDVMIVFAVFMFFKQYVMNSTLLRIGQNTLAIYVIHFVILYGSFTGLGLYRYFNNALSPEIVIPGAILFMISCSYLALQYEKHEVFIKDQLKQLFRQLKSLLELILWTILKAVRTVFVQLQRIFSPKNG